jgi:rSAM/selenodomain-associated transferase 2
MISVVVPTLNEARALPALLTALQNEWPEHETIIVDGGSPDATVAIARARGARVLHAPPGRGGQLCAGARKASGDILLFLHADSTFPAGGLRAIDATLAADPRLVGGNFRLLFDGDRRFSRWLTRFYARIRRVGLYYGDSGIFVRRRVYDAIGGFRPIPVMEDFDFVRRLERFGRTCCIREPPLITSSRRFEGRRMSAIVRGWIALHLLFRLGVPPERLARLYSTQAPRGREWG